MEDKAYIDNQIQWLKELSEAEFRAVRDAVNKVERTGEQYRASQNEWRGQLSDQAATFATKEMVDATKQAGEKALETQDREIATLKNSLSNLQGRIVGFGLVWTLLLILLSWFINKAMT
jgi:arginine utilization protein RocB